MKTIKLGYYQNFGTKKLEKAKNIFEKSRQRKLKLIALNQKEIKDQLDSKQIDIALTDPGDIDYLKYQVTTVKTVGIMAVLQAGNFLSGQQTVELEELKNIPDLLIAKEKDEASELHYHRDLLQIKSPFLAVESFNEAALMAESGSGYFLMNEITAPAITNNQLQKMFLLRNNKQMEQKYVTVHANNETEIINLIKLLQQVI